MCNIGYDLAPADLSVSGRMEDSTVERELL